MNGTYYAGAAPIIQQQIAKGGVRLAAWLNQAFAGESGFWRCSQLVLIEAESLSCSLDATEPL